MAKVAFHFAPEQRADVAVSEILMAYLQKMEANEKGATKGMFPECLHDFRVAIRSSRSILTQTKGVFAERPHARFKSALNRLARTTSVLRDLDVLLLRLDMLVTELPPGIQKDLAPFHRYLQKRKRVEQRQLKETLQSEHILRFKGDYTRFLSKTALGQNRPAGGRRPISRVAGKAIRKAYHAVRDHEDTTTANSPIERLHDLRKLYKKLRYSLEAFQSLYPRDKIRPFIKDLKRLQDTLGALVDLDVQRQLLQQWRQAMQKEKRASPRTLEAILTLEGMLTRHHEQQPTDSLNVCFHQFFRPSNKKRFQKLFR